MFTRSQDEFSTKLWYISLFTDQPWITDWTILSSSISTVAKKTERMMGTHMLDNVMLNAFSRI